jgi:hypothetical protein
VLLLGLYHALAALLILYFLFVLWPRGKESERQVSIAAPTAEAEQQEQAVPPPSQLPAKQPAKQETSPGTGAPAKQAGASPQAGKAPPAAPPAKAAPETSPAKQPAAGPAKPEAKGWWERLCDPEWCKNLDFEIRLLLIVALAGALGAYVHAAQSFVTFVGNRRIVTSWIWWYLLRPFIGMALAEVFYLVVRGGFFASTAQTQAVNVFGVAALAGMAGMFSKEATDKLHEAFKTLFQLKKEVARTDKPNGSGGGST